MASRVAPEAVHGDMAPPLTHEVVLPARDVIAEASWTHAREREKLVRRSRLPEAAATL